MFNVLNLFISTAIFFSRWTQLNYPWLSFLCSVALDDSQLPFMLSCWCSMQPVNTFFFDWPIYLLLHEQLNWCTPGWLLGSSLGLSWHGCFLSSYQMWISEIRKNSKKIPCIANIGPKNRKNFKKADKAISFTSDKNLQSILCQNKPKLIPNSHPGLHQFNCLCNDKYIG